MNEIGIHDLDLDVQNFVTKYIADDESLIYLRLKRVSDDRLDEVHAIDGDMGDILGALINIQEFKDLAITATVIMIKEGLDINEYMTDESLHS